MKQATNMQRTIQFLNKAFDLINDHYYGGQLPKCVITVQSARGTHAHFYYSGWTRTNADGTEEQMTEINLAAGTIGSRDVCNVLGSLNHEMVHYWCYCCREGIIPCDDISDYVEVSRNGYYHNSIFRREAEKRGLQISYDKRIGWSITEVTPEFLDFIIEAGLDKFISLNRNEYDGHYIGGTAGAGTTIKPPAPKKSNSIKLQCPRCRAIARVTRENIRLICFDCHEELVRA